MKLMSNFAGLKIRLTMKQFWKMVFAAFCALVIFCAVCSVLSLFLLVSLTAAGSGTPSIPKSGGLSISGVTLGETSSEGDYSPLSLVQSGIVKTTGIWETVQAVNAAAEDPAIKFVYIKADEIDGGMSQLEELRGALQRFRSCGKPIIAYTEYPTTGSYWLMSVADKIYMSANSGCSPQMTGVAARIIFYKDLLDKLGVNVQLIRHGKYKSAGEAYVRNSPSPENRHQYEEMIGSIWESIAGETAQGRGISPESLSAMIDNLSLGNAEDMVENGLVDELVTKEDLDGKLMTLAGVSKRKDVKMTRLEDYIQAKVPESNGLSKKKIAIIYAEGNIVEGNGKSGVAGDRFAREIAAVRADSTVKAVVFRVNSPGGTVLASDKIRTEIDLLRKEKPVIASYGDYAASGGYWISSSCDKIFSDKTTLTGSIGVFSLVPDLSKTARDLVHVNVVAISSSKHGDMLSGMRPLDADELAYMQESVEEIYDDFVGRVAEGRGLDGSYVDEIAQGRVWTGAEALKIGLVDEIGSIEDAIHYAVLATGAVDSNLDGWDVVAYPKQPGLAEKILDLLGMGETRATILGGTPFEGVELAFKNWDWQTSDRFFARLPYDFEFTY